MVQIFKLMVDNAHKYNQYVLRDIKDAYIDTDYERSRYREGEDANSLTLRLKFDNMRTLTERAARLEPALLMPFDAEKNPKGVKFENFSGESLVIWGLLDQMMASSQAWRFKAVLYNSNVQISYIDNADHFVETDQPERVAEAMYDFIARVVGTKNMGDICLGLDSRMFWQGDEKEALSKLRRLYGVGL